MSNSSNSSGIGFVWVLQILFIGLKLGNVITWSWLAVLSPMLISIAVLLLLVVLVTALD